MKKSLQKSFRRPSERRVISKSSADGRLTGSENLNILVAGPVLAQVAVLRKISPSRMNKTKIARLVSLAGHPFVMIVLLVLLLSWTLDRPAAGRITGFVAAIGLIPTGLLLWRRAPSRRRQTADASAPDDRAILYFSLFAVLLLSSVYFHFVEHSALLVRGSAITALMSAVAAVFNRWIRLSLHLAFAVYSGLILAKIHPGYGLPILVLAPLLAWSRLVLLRHTLPEVIGGAALGLGAAGTLIWLWPQG
jgi:membrane-associated phospholipid phosphatase